MPSDTDRPVLVIRLFGAFAMGWEEGAELRVRSVKLRALIAMLATAAEGTRTRAWLQDMLWSRSGHEHGRASLRRALTDLRNLFGDSFADVFEANNTEVHMHLDRIRIAGSLEDGEFLEGIDIAEEGFEDWLRSQRQGNRTIVQATAPRPAQVLEVTPARAPDHLQPALAVLPFATARGFDGPAVLGDMISEELSRSLSRSHLLDVISHLSCRTLDARSVALAEIRGALDADYVVCGNYRVDGDQIILNADFIDARSGRIAWTRELPGSLRDFLKGEEELVRRLATEIGRGVTDTSVELARSTPLNEVATHAVLMSGVSLMHRFSVASFARARDQLLEVAERAPNKAPVHAWIAKWHVLSVVQGWSSDIAADRAEAADRTAMALDIDPECPFSLSIDGLVQYHLYHRFDEAMDRLQDVTEMDPNNALAWLLQGTLLAFSDHGAEALKQTERARSLSPLDPHKYYFDSLAAAAALSAGNYERGLELANLSMRQNRRHVSTLRARTVALQRLGRVEEARVSAEELLRAEPGLTVRGYLQNHPAAQFKAGQDWASALREAGIPA